MTTLSRIHLRRAGRRSLSLRAITTVADRYVIARDTPHSRSAFCPVLVLDLTTEEAGTYRPAAGTGVYATETEATNAATDLVAA